MTNEVWLVAREGQALPLDLPVARDPGEGLGPLAGIAAGLEAMAAPRAFVTACDVPFLVPALVEQLIELCEGHDAAVPRVDGHAMVATAAYDKRLAPVAQELLAAGARRPRDLLDRADVRWVEADELRECDPSLDSLFDCDTPESYAEALERAGLGARGT